MTSANSHVRFTVEDEDAGRRYSFSLDNQQYQRLTVAQVQRMVIEASRDASPSASTMTTKQVAGTPVKHHIGTLSYESAIVTLHMKAAQHAPSLLPGSFALLDTNKHALLDGNARAATHMDLHRNTPFYVVRNHHHYQHQRSPSNSSVLFVEEPPTRILSAVSSSAVSFVVNSDGDEEEENTQTDGSVSFQEDVVSMTYEALMPSENITSPVQSVQFETEEEEDRTIEFDTISFATVDSVLTAEQRSSAAVQGETAVAGTPGSQKATTISNPVASMTVRQRFEYYQARGKRKKVAGRPTAHATTTTRTRATTTTTTAAASLPASTHVTHRKVSTAAVPGPAVTSATAPRSTNAHSSVAPPTEPSVSTTTISRKMKRKPVVPKTEKCKKQQQPAEAIDAPTTPFLFSGQAAATTATEREMKLVVLVQQLQEDVEKLLVQSQSDVSRIAALRRALTETRKEYLALREAHCSSLNQLNAYAAQIASGVLPIRQQDEEPREGEKSHTVTAAAGVSMPDVVVKQQEQQQQQQEQRQDSLHEEEVGVGVSAATMSGEVPEEEGKQKDDETEEKSQQTAPANTLGASHGDDKAAGVTEAPSTTPAPQEPELHIVTDNSQEESEQTQQMIQQQPTSAEETPVEEDNVVTKGAVPSESAAEGAVPSESAAEGAVPSESAAEGAVPSESAAEGAVPSESAAEGAVPSESAAEGAVPSESAAEGAVPSESAAEGAVPSESAAEGAVPSESAAEGAVPSESAAEGAVPSESAAEGAVPSESAAEGAVPSESAAEGAVPSESAAEGAVPSESAAEGAVPSESAAEGAVPSESAAEGAVPSESAAEGAVPSESAAEGAVPSESAAEGAVPSESAAEGAVPSESAAEGAVPSESAAEGAVPSESAAEGAVPSESAAEGAVPSESAAEGAVPSESAAEGAVPSESAAEGAAAAAAPTHESRQPFIRPIPALLHFTNEEARVLLRQIGYIYHNRLLRRENALLMCQLQLLKDQAKTNKMCGGAGNVQRLRVVVRIRPVGLASALPTAEARRDSVLRVASPVALTPPSSHSQHRNSAQVTSPKEHSVEEDPNPPYASSVVSPLSSHYSASFISKERATTAAGMPTAPGDVFLQCNFGDNRLQVHNPELYVNNSTSTTTAAMIARDSGAVLRGVRIIGPPLPQSLFSVSATATSAVQALESSSASTLLHSVTEDQGETSGLALRAAAAVQQRRLYEEVVAPLVAGALRGESGTVLAYGQVGSGKTYTMFGRCGVSSGEDGEGGSHAESKSPVVFGELPAEAGVVPRALADLFDQLRDKAASEELLLRSLYASRYDMAFQATINMKASSKDATAAALSEASLANLVALSCVPMCEVQCSMLELYNDRVRDLLAPKIEVPRYEESLTATTGVKGNPEYRSSDSSAERRTQWQLRQAQAAQLGQRESTVDSDVEQRRLIGCEYIVPECAVRPCVDGGARVDGATRVTVHNMCEALQLLERGLANRETHETALNAQSSRSHVILTVTIKQQQWCGEEAAAATVDVAAPATTGEEMETDVSAEDASVAAKKSQRMKGSATTTKNKAATATVKKATKKSETKSKTTAKATAAAAPADTAMTGATPVERQRKVPTQEVSTDDSAVKITTAAEMEEQEDKAQDKYLRCRSVKSVTSQLVFIDLAGTGQGTGELFSGKAERLREAQAIGKSLAALGDIMSALYGGSGVARAAKPAAAGKATATAFSGSAAHVPFRSHRLTMLLRNALVKPTACVVLACVALSERPMAALLADTVPLASNCSASAQSNSLASQAPLLAEQQYWRLATERLMAAQCAKSTTETAAATGSASSVASPTTVSRRPSTRASVRSSIVHNSVFASPSAGQLAGKRKSTSKSTVLSSRRDSASLLDLHKLSIASEEETEESSNRKSVSQQESSPAVQHVAANVTIDAGAAQEPSVDSEFVAQMTAIQANADAEDRAVSGALWITPRETVSTLAFLSRLWKA